MNLLSLCGGAVFLLVPLTCISSLRADSIDRNGGEDYAAIVSKLELDDHSGSPAADYSFFQDGPYFGDYFGDPGLIPGSFLFGGNTSWDFTGSQQVTIISAVTDPGQS